MQKGLTWILSLLAVALFAFIYLYERKIPSSAERVSAPRLLPGIEPSKVVAIEITLAGGGVVRAEQTNGVWTLRQPLYRAEQSAIETFVTNVANMHRYDRLAQHEVALQGQKSFGLDPARATVQLETATNQVRFQVGGFAPLTNNIYLRLEPSNEVVLADADFLRSFPFSTNDWRSGDLLPMQEMAFDHVQIRAGQRMFELGKNPTNNLWQITKPIPARGDQNQIAALFDQLGKAQVEQFLADGNVNLERYGLQAPELEVDFTQGTNRLFTVEFGTPATNQTNQVHARLLGNTNIVTVNRDLLLFLKQPYKAFHDPRLIALNPKLLDRIAVQSFEKFILQRQPDGRWAIGDKSPIPADTDLINAFLRTMLGMRILDIVKEVPTDADLQSLGLQVPRISYSFYEELPNKAGITTNILYSEVSFGTNLNDKIYARRSDETPVYMTELAPLLEMPHYAMQMRERQIWNFSTNEVLRVTLKDGSRTNSATRSGGGWSSDALASAAIQEAIFRLSQLKVTRWVAKGEEAKRTAGVTSDSGMLEVELTTPTGTKVQQIQFGKEAPRHNMYGMEPAEGEALIFEFPGEIYHLLLQNLPAIK
jgi:hypothetical protein